MERRKAIQTLGLGFSTLLALPSWVNSWSKASFAESNFENEVTLAALVECIIPESETPGAKAVGAHLYLERMVNGCYGTDVKKMFLAGLEKLEKRSSQKYNKAFSELDLEKRTAVLASMKNASEVSDKRFFSFVKNLTVRAYTHSEYYLTTYRNYVMAPGYFHGCVPV
ncbi:gluconate 2-dehydrogenase subunit 3 family protein [uncultured Arcticibacterium sp.]|uniref:gluconate 2-dehydrogenase subunit 3 family protein n=1 Tax=uncultured Arcticibacterium sp. TaxID=2173042 RepID=UPI0030FAF171